MSSICLQCRRPRFNPWVRKIPWSRKWQSTPVLLPGKSHGQRRLVGYSAWGHKESDMTEQQHAKYIMRNTGLEEAQARINIARRNINNLRYANDTTLMTESEEELNSLLMKVKVPGSSVHGIFQARVVEWIAISFSRGYSQPRA